MTGAKISHFRMKYKFSDGELDLPDDEEDWHAFYPLF